MEESRLERDFRLCVNDALVKVWNDKTYSVSSDEGVSNIASFMATNSIQNVFQSIAEEEKMGFSDNEILLKRMDVYYDSIDFYFILPNGAIVSKKVKVLKPQQMTKNVYSKYLSIFKELKRRQEIMEEEARKQYEEEKMKREIEEMTQKCSKLEQEKEKLLERVGKLSEEIKILTSIVKKRISEDEVYEEEDEEKEKLSEEEREYLKEHIFDC